MPGLFQTTSHGGHHVKTWETLPKALRAESILLQRLHILGAYYCFDPRGPNPDPRWIPPHLARRKERMATIIAKMVEYYDMKEERELLKGIGL